MRRSQKTLAALSVLVGLVPATGGIAEGQRHHDPHVHGLGQLNLVIEGRFLAIELETPANDIVGFEHLPGNPEEEERVRVSTATLKQGTRLFVPPPASGCRLIEAEVASKLLAEDGGHDHPGEEHHSEFHGNYRFQCDDPAGLTHLDVPLFRLFPTIKELEVRFSTPGGQGLVHLHPENSRVSF